MTPRHLVIGTAGHIDHGKSALVRALTGTDPDRLKEEKDRGITIDLGFARWQGGEASFAFVDVPGHERFVKNMLAGVGGIDAVLLVVAADESVMPQTREHFDICRLLRVPCGVVALTKRDLVDAEVLDLAALEVREFVSGSFLEGAAIVPVSATTGEGLDDLRRALADLAGKVPPRDAGGLARLPVDRAFTVKGFGTVVTGTLVSGSVRADDDLALLPAGHRVKVRGVQVHGAREVAAAAGQRVALNLGGIELDQVGRGDSLLTPGTLQPTRMLDARLEVVASANPLRHGSRLRFHQGTSEVLGRVALAAILPAPAAVPDQAPLQAGAEVPPGREAYVRLRLESPAVLSRGDRFILRAYSPAVTVAGGVVLDPHPARSPIRTAAARRRFDRLDPLWHEAGAAPSGDQATTDRAIELMAGERGLAGLDVPALVTRAGVPPAAVDATIDRLVRARAVVRAGGTLVAPASVEAASARVLQMLGDHHRAEPLSEGMPREEVRERVFARAGEGVFDLVLRGLESAAKLTGRDRLALSSHRVSLSDEERRAHATIESAFREAGLRPPEPSAVGAATGLPPGIVERVTQLLVRQKVLVKVDTLIFHQQALQRLKGEMAALKETGGAPARIDVATFKERYAVTRKYAIPLLEYLDRERVTRRVGDARVLL